MARSYGSERIDGSELGLVGSNQVQCRHVVGCGQGLAYSRGLTCQSEAPTKAWYSAGEIDRLEYRQLITNMFLSCCQSLRTTSHSKVPPELTVIIRISPGFGMAFISTCLPNRTSLFAMVSGASFPSRRTRREGILRLISTVCAI